MNTMLEKAKKALVAEELMISPEEAEVVWDGLGENDRARISLIVRGVLGAIRIPDDAMIEAGYQTPGVAHGDEFTAIIDALLAQEAGVVTTVIDFETERAERRCQWMRWADNQPETGLVIRLRGQLTLAGGGAPAPGSKFVRRTQALCLIPEDGGTMRLVRPPYDNLEWMPG